MGVMIQHPAFYFSIFSKKMECNYKRQERANRSGRQAGCRCLNGADPAMETFLEGYTVLRDIDCGFDLAP